MVMSHQLTLLDHKQCDDDDDDDSFIQHTAHCTHEKVKQEVQDLYKALPIEQSNEK